jgi:hypothetical protein
MSAFLGEGFGCGRANALRGAGDKDAFAAQMKVHGIARWIGVKVRGVSLRLRPAQRSTLHCTVARGKTLVHCNPNTKSLYQSGLKPEGISR